VEALISLNKWTNIILLNYTALRLFGCFVKQRKLKTETHLQSALAFIVILIIDNWLSYFPIDRVKMYYSFCSSIFLSFYFTRDKAAVVKFFGIASTGMTLYFLNVSVLTQISFMLSIVILIIGIKNSLLGSSNQRRNAIVLSSMAAYLFSQAEAYTFSLVGHNWGNSKHLIYFAIGDFLMFTTMLLIVNANLRRLFYY
jgi:hypothetical protein